MSNQRENILKVDEEILKELKVLAKGVERSDIQIWRRICREIVCFNIETGNEYSGDNSMIIRSYLLDKVFPICMYFYYDLRTIWIDDTIMWWCCNFTTDKQNEW